MTFSYVRNIVLNYVLNKCGHIKRKKLDILKEKVNICQSLLDKYKNDTNDLYIIIACMKYNIYKFPTCPTCGKKLKFQSSTRNHLFNKHCSEQCSSLDTDVKRKNSKTTFELYGKEFFFQTDVFKEKTKETHLRKRGVEYHTQTQETKNKIKHTKFINHGDENYNNHQQYIETCLKLYGVENILCLAKYHDSITNNKRIKTMKENGTLGKRVSPKEYEILDYIKTLFPDVEHQYTESTVYPFNCDFYIPSINTYIEYQGSQFHHNHIYDPQNKEDINELHRMELQKQQHPQYIGIIDTWTKADPLKRSIAKQNNVNLIEIWPNDNYKDIINNLIL